MELHKPLRGVITAMITPLRARDELDHAGLERLVEHLIAGGVHGLFILGTTGEAPGLSYRLRAELIERTCKQVAERLPVIVGITDTAFVEAASLAAAARKFGAAGGGGIGALLLSCQPSGIVGVCRAPCR
jgi:4-hydroxy-tetrahydrodipicolinate synthase